MTLSKTLNYIVRHVKWEVGLDDDWDCVMPGKAISFLSDLLSCHWLSRAGFMTPSLTWLCSCQPHCLVMMELMEMPASLPLHCLLLVYPNLSSSYRTSWNYFRALLATPVLNGYSFSEFLLYLSIPYLFNVTIYWFTCHSFCGIFWYGRDSGQALLDI